MVPGPPAGIPVPPGTPGNQDIADDSREAPAAKACRTPGKRAWVARTPDLQQLAAAIRKNARQQGVDEDLVWAVMHRESGFNTRAVSPKGAMGLMQLMPGTAARLGVDDPFDVEQNVAGGVKYLRHCLDYFDQDLDLALAAYNAGPGNVVKHRGVPPFAETIKYVAAVLKDFIAQVRPGRLDRPSGQQDLQAAESGLQVAGLNWRVPLARWRIALPQERVGAPRWRIGSVALEKRGQKVALLSGKRVHNPKAPAGEKKVSSL
jgi:hypothetical protein